MKTMHLFAGGGGGLLADLILGHTPIVAVEWDKYACDILRERAKDGWFEGLSVWEGDVRLFDPSEYKGKVDCIHAGFPCQDLSFAGKQKGLGEGTRSGLYREVLRIANVVRPRVLFLENVSAILSNGLGTVLADLATMGYDARWCCIRASDVGAPHQRDRWWLRAEQRNILSHTEHDRNGCRKQQQESSEKKIAYLANARCKLRKKGNAIRMDSNTQKRSYSELHNKSSCKGFSNSKCVNRKQWWEVEPNVGRVANGVASWSHKLKALGNGQVPLQAALAWRLLEK